MQQGADSSPAADEPRLRLFVALHCPLSPALAAACALVRSNAAAAGLRTVATDTLHVTLSFLGTTPANRVAVLADRINTVAHAHAPMTLELRDAGCFRDALWLGLAPAPALANLAQDLAAAFETLGFAADHRPFQPHLTLARLQRGTAGKPERQALLKALSNRAWGSFRAGQVHLWQSVLQPPGPVYTVLHSGTLGTGRGA